MTVARALLFAALLLALPAASFAQTARVFGKTLDAAGDKPVVGTLVRLTLASDPSKTYSAASKADGVFELKDVPQGFYRLSASRQGYATLEKPARVAAAEADLGSLSLTVSAVQLREIDVKSQRAAALQKADTTEFSADVFKTQKDATAEDLVAKLPGVTTTNGTVKHNGENVQQVLVDGKPFFGGDPTASLRNLPAEVIDRVQVYDRTSDISDFTGFDDGQTTKTMNVMLRNDKRNGVFGKSYGGYGADTETGGDDRHSAGTSTNIFKGATRLSLIGMANNLDQQNFSPQDILGVLNVTPSRGMMAAMGGGGHFFGNRGGGGGRRFGGGSGGGGGPGFGTFFVGQQDGVNTTRSVGGNLTSAVGATFTVAQSYFYNSAGNDNTQDLLRQYSVPVNGIASYTQHGVTSSDNGNHRFDGRYSWNPDSTNSFMLVPKVYLQENTSTANIDGTNATASGSVVNKATSVSTNEYTGNNLSTHALYRHRFPKKGRTFAVDFGLGHTLRDATGTLDSRTQFFDEVRMTSTVDTVDQRSTGRTTTSQFTTRATFTEPLGGLIMGQLFYAPAINRSSSDNRAFTPDTTGAYTMPNLALSNTFENRTTTQNGGVAVLYRKGGARLTSTLAVQQNTLRSERTYPGASEIEKTFTNVLPSIQLVDNFDMRRSLRATWSTSTPTPSISQLQDVVDNSNPLALSVGNPDLTQSYVNSLAARYLIADPMHSRSTFLLVSVDRTTDYIGRSTTTATRDTTLPGGIVQRAGTQLTRPVNLDGARSANTFMTTTIPVTPLKSTLSLNTGLNFSRTPGVIEDQRNLTSTYGYTGGLVLNSTRSQNLDFTVAYFGTYNVSRNSLSHTQDSDYYTHRANATVNATFAKNTVMRQELSNSLLHGVSGGYSQNVVLWNASLAQKFLARQRGEFKVSAQDILDRSRNANRTVTETYVEDSTNRVLGRYLLATFTYTIR